VTADRPRVDVVVVTHNTADLTVRALRHLLDVPDPLDLRVIVRDNGSTDGTPAAIRDHVPEADLDAGSRNLGFAAGVNRALARSDAEWVLLLNSDAWPEPGAISALVDTARTEPGAALVAPRLERPDGGLEHSTHPFPSARVAAVMALGAPRWLGADRLRRWCVEGRWAHDEPREVDWAVGAAWLLRRAALDDVGGLDERYFMYAEDLEWCWRARRAGWSVLFEPAAVVRHVGNASGAAAYGDRRTAAYLANSYRFYRREHGAVATAAYQLLNAAGTARGWAAARARRDDDVARWWASQLRVHVRRHGELDPGPAR
jgi:GT2 family glycosyltransferase